MRLTLSRHLALELVRNPEIVHERSLFIYQVLVECIAGCQPGYTLLSCQSQRRQFDAEP